MKYIWPCVCVCVFALTMVRTRIYIIHQYVRCRCLFSTIIIITIYYNFEAANTAEQTAGMPRPRNAIVIFFLICHTPKYIQCQTDNVVHAPIVSSSR